MTGPPIVPGRRSVGSVWAEMRISTDKVDDDVHDGLDAAAKDAERDQLPKIGKDMGDALGEGVGDSLEKQGPEFARRLGKGVDGKTVKAKVNTDIDVDRDSVQRFVTRFGDEIEDAISDAGRPGGPLNRIGSAFADAIGAGFNISGRSPLIVGLIFVVGAIIELVFGAIEAVGGLVALLAIVPGLVAAIGLEAGTLFIAFKGVGDAVKDAFNAKDAKELNEAIKNLTPSAQDFVKQLLPARDLFKEIKEGAQEGFFSQFGDVIERVLSGPSPDILPRTFFLIAEGLGRVARELVFILNDPVFIRFLNTIVPSILKFLEGFGPALDTLIVGFLNLITAATPFMDWFGEKFNQVILDFGQWLSDLSTDQGFLGFLEKSKVTLKELWGLMGAVVRLGVALFTAIDAISGDSALKELTEQIDTLAKAIESPAGQKSLEGLLKLSVFLAQALIGILFLIGLIAAGFAYIFEFLGGVLGPEIGKLAEWWIKVGNAFNEGFYDVLVTGFNIIKGAIEDLGMGIGDWLNNRHRDAIVFFTNIWVEVKKFWENTGGAAINAAVIVQAVWNNAFNFFVAWINYLPGLIVSQFNNLGGSLFQAGWNILNGLIAGIWARFPDLKAVLSYIAMYIRWFFPFSPAKVGPLSGKGDLLYAGQNLMERLMVGMQMEVPQLGETASDAANSIVFGANSIQVGFNGVVPTRDQAYATGLAVGEGVTATLARRDTRLMVRSLNG